MSKAAHRIFVKFYMKPECLKGQKLSQPSFRKSLKILAEKGCFDSCQKFSPLMCTFLPKKLCIPIFCMILWKRHAWEKAVSSVMVWITLNHSDCHIFWLLISVEEIKPYLTYTLSYLDFFQGDNHQGKVLSEITTFGWV